MAGKRDYYEVLSVSRTATDGEISSSYRKLAIKYHPDKNPGDEEAVRLFKEAAEAFEVLSDSEKRARYDRYGHAGVDGPGGGGAHFTDVNDIFQAFGDVFGDSVFGDLFGGGRANRGGRRAQKGNDIRCDVTLDLLEAARGDKDPTFQPPSALRRMQRLRARPGTKPETCRYCGGRGQVVQSSGIFRVQTTCPSCHGSGSKVTTPCEKCEGKGQTAERIAREVTIPAGVDQQTRLRLTGEGDKSPGGGPAGDCYVFIAVKEHALFHRDGMDLICQMPITFTQAALGASVEVPTLDGPEDLKIPAGTQTGAVFKLRGRGMPDPRRRGTGDLLVQVHLEVPRTLTPKQKELLRELANEEHVNVSPEQKSFFDKLRDYFVPQNSEDEK